MRWKVRERACAPTEQRRIRVARRTPRPAARARTEGSRCCLVRTETLSGLARRVDERTEGVLLLERGASGHLRSRVRRAVDFPFVSRCLASSCDAQCRSTGARCGDQGVIPGKISQSEPRFAPNGCRKKCRAAPRGQKSDFRGAYLDRRFHISRGFPTTTPACILCGNYPIRPGRP
jgi:hypothetical protein